MPRSCACLFAQRWEALLPSLVSQTTVALGTQTPRDWVKGAGLLQIAHSIFKRCRGPERVEL
eukprot:213128-Pleurochrysis_carterae.AAC.4